LRRAQACGMCVQVTGGTVTAGLDPWTDVRAAHGGARRCVRLAAEASEMITPPNLRSAHSFMCCVTTVRARHLVQAPFIGYVIDLCPECKTGLDRSSPNSGDGRWDIAVRGEESATLRVSRTLGLSRASPTRGSSLPRRCLQWTAVPCPVSNISLQYKLQ